MSEHHPISDLMTETMSKIKEMVDVNTIIGNPIVAADGTTVIPVSKVSFGFGAGGSEFASKHAASGSPLAFGGGSGSDRRCISSDTRFEFYRAQGLDLIFNKK